MCHHSGQNVVESRATAEGVYRPRLTTFDLLSDQFLPSNIIPP